MPTYEDWMARLAKSFHAVKTAVRRFSMITMENIETFTENLIFKIRTYHISRVFFVRPLASKNSVLAKSGSSLSASFVPYVWNGKVFVIRVPGIDLGKAIPTSRLIAVDLAYTLSDPSLPPSLPIHSIEMKSAFEKLAGPSHDFHGHRLTVADLLNFARRRDLASGPLINAAERNLRNATGEAVKQQIDRELHVTLMKAVGGISKIVLKIGDHLNQAFE